MLQSIIFYRFAKSQPRSQCHQEHALVMDERQSKNAIRSVFSAHILNMTKACGVRT
jgi:hypothetical protein